MILEPVESWPKLDAAPVARSGPCGFNERVGVDYNFPAGEYGAEPVETYKAGEVVEVEWCVDNNGDHGGMFAYRICQDDDIVAKLIDPDHEPTEEEKQEAEDCFQEGLLACTDVDGQECPYSPDCGEDEDCYRDDWFTCEAQEGGACKAVDGAKEGSCETTISAGYTVTKKIKIPDYTSKHTLLSFKWNSYETGQIYLSCADIAIS